MSSPDPTSRATVRRLPERGAYDRPTIDAILDEALVCHVGVIDDGEPLVIPFIPTRIDEGLYIHGASNNHMMTLLSAGVPACVTTTLLDGLVLARSAFHHSMNYRSVVVFARGEVVSEAGEKRKALYALVEDVIPGRLADLPPIPEADINATCVVRFPLTEASAKIRTGPPGDRERDRQLPIWAGVLPLSLQAGKPLPDELVPPGSDVPAYLNGYKRSRS